MSVRSRLLIGLTALLLFAAGWMLRGWPSQIRGSAPIARTVPAAPLAGTNIVSALRVRQAEPGLWTVDFDYFYTGQPYSASLSVTLTPQDGSAPQLIGQEHLETYFAHPKPGEHHVSGEIAYPGGVLRTVQVSALMRTQMFGHVIASEHLSRVIDWPDFQTWLTDQQIGHSSQHQNFERAVGLINSEAADQMSEAKNILEQLIQANPRFDAGYVQLARIAMKSDGGPQGLHQAEDLLASALQIRPDSADAKILLGQVYAHQGRFKRAEALFEQVARTPVTNLWLWSNWGEMYQLEHKPAQAIVEYRRVIASPMTHDDNDRARLFAYDDLLQLLKARDDLDGMEALYRQRLREFGPGSCYSTDYARFLLQVRGKVQAAIDLAKGALNQSCDDAPARQVLGLERHGTRGCFGQCENLFATWSPAALRGRLTKGKIKYVKPSAAGAVPSQPACSGAKSNLPSS